MKKNVIKKGLFLGVVACVCCCNVCGEQILAQQNEQQNAQQNDRINRIDQYRDGLAKYCLKRYKIDLNKVSPQDRAVVEKLAEKLRAYLKQIEGVPASELDEHSHDKVELEAGNFDVIGMDELKKLAEHDENVVMVCSMPESVAAEFKQGKFKINLGYFNGMRGNSNYFGSCDSYGRSDMGIKCCGAQNLHGGLHLTTDVEAAWPDYRFHESLILDEQETKNLEVAMPQVYDVLGFVLNLNEMKQIKLADLKRYVYILMHSYPEEFGFVDEHLKLFSTNHFKKRMEADGEKGGCWHGFDLSSNFDFKVQIEREVQKELFGVNFSELEEIENEDEQNKKMQELNEKLNTNDYIVKLKDRLIKAGKKEHVINKTYYLLHNYVLLAKLLGFDVVVDEGAYVDKKSGNQKRHIRADLVNTGEGKGKVKVCVDEFKTRGECPKIKAN